jgi:hypothetical protein
MIDQDGDNRIKYDEFLNTAKEAMEDEKRAANRDTPQVQEVLKQVSEYMIKNRVSNRAVRSYLVWHIEALRLEVFS